MKKITLLLALLFTTTMNIFAQDTPEATGVLRLLSTYPSTTEEIENIGSIEFTFSEKVIVVTDIVKFLEIKNEADETVAQIALENASIWENTVYPSIVPVDTIWHKYIDEKNGETNQYPEYVYPDMSIPGQYTMTIPAGVFVSAQDNTVTLAETVLTFNVIGKQPTWWTDYDYTTAAKEFEKITISFENVNSVKLNNGIIPMLYTESGAEHTGTATLINEVDEKEGKTTTKIEITFGDKFTSVDTYYIMIPAGMFTMNEDVNNEEKMLTLDITKPIEVTPLEIVSVTPAAGEVGQIEKIIITFNQNVILAYDENWQAISSTIYLKDANGNEYELTENYNPSLGWNQLEYVCGEYDNNWNMVYTPITEVGTYTLDISQIVVDYGHDAATNEYNATGSCEGIYTWTIGDTAIDGIDAEAENAEIFDLTGRRVNNITNAGIYIINGVKKIVK